MRRAGRGAALHHRAAIFPLRSTAAAYITEVAPAAKKEVTNSSWLLVLALALSMPLRVKSQTRWRKPERVWKMMGKERPNLMGTVTTGPLRGGSRVRPAGGGVRRGLLGRTATSQPPPPPEGLPPGALRRRQPSLGGRG